MLARWGIRLATSLAGIAVGIIVSAALLDRFSVDVGAVVLATALFWIVHLVVQFLALRVLIRQPSVALAGLLALGSTVIALIVVDVVIDGISISGLSTYVLATLIIWVSTVVGDIVGGRMTRARRADAED